MKEKLEKILNSLGLNSIMGVEIKEGRIVRNGKAISDFQASILIKSIYSIYSGI